MLSRWRFALVWVLMCGLSCAAIGATAAADTTYSFNLPEQNLSDALRAIGRQTTLNIMFAPKAVEHVKAPAIRGEFTAEQAITRALAGTRLQWLRTMGNSVLVESPEALTSREHAANVAGSNLRTAPDSVVGLLRVAQNSGSGNASTPGEQGDSSLAPTEVVITGSRIPVTPGGQTLPVRSYEREAIERSGQGTLASFLNTLPDVSLASVATNDGTPGSVTVQLHGLPVGTTLTLIDGRRAQKSTGAYFDLNNIPAGAVERIEVLPVGASAIYGADALAGAVNVVLRKDFQGFEASAATTYLSGSRDETASIGWGHAWERGSAMVVATYDKVGLLLNSERDFLSSADYPEGAPTYIYYGDDCAPGNVYSLNGGNLPGLSSPMAGVPEGITGRPDVGQFAATAGLGNVCNYYARTAIVPESSRAGLLATAAFQLTDSAELYSQLIASRATSSFPIGDALDACCGGVYILGAGNPYNPFGEDVGVSFKYAAGPSLAYDMAANLVRPIVGIKGSLAGDWHYDVSALWSRDQVHRDTQYVDWMLVQEALLSSDPDTALNPFTTGAPGTPELLNALYTSGISRYRVAGQVSQVQSLLRGPLAQLPAGPLQVAVGAEYSRETLHTTFANLGRHEYAAFGEARIPLLGSSDSPNGVGQLAATAAARFDHSSDFGGKSTWQAGLAWRPLESVALNGSYGVSYRAPRLNEIGGGVFVYPGTATAYPDPFRGNELIVADLAEGPNANLDPETGSARTLSLVYTPVPAARASLTWYDIRITNFIGTPSAATLVQNPDVYPDAVVRAPQTPEDIANGYPGRITAINLFPYNYGDLHVAGVDADFRYTLTSPWGRVTPAVSVSNVYRWMSALTPGEPTASYVNQLTWAQVGWAPRWKGNVSLAWQAPSSGLSAVVTGRYVGRYDDSQDWVPNTNRLGNTWWTDVNVRYDFAGSFARTRSSYVALGVVDLFDRKPPFSFGTYPFDRTQYDARGRLVQVRVGARW